MKYKSQIVEVSDGDFSKFNIEELLLNEVFIFKYNLNRASNSETQEKQRLDGFHLKPMMTKSLIPRDPQTG